MRHAVFMAGGKGTRFWPLSRKACAKQFLSLMHDTTLLDSSIKRLDPLLSLDQVLLVGNAQQETYLKDRPFDFSQDQYLVEPVGRNTAACIGWAAAALVQRDPDAIMAVLPADHYIRNSAGFRQTLESAFEVVESAPETLVTIGISPTSPHTGYGYIHAQASDDVALRVASFTEKPDLDTAQHFVNSGDYYWNSGMFVWKASTILSLMQQHLPDHFDRIQQIMALDREATDYESQLSRLYDGFESISIDYGIMEKAADATKMIVANFDWSDIGSWSALGDLWAKDSDGNTTQGPFTQLDSKNNVVLSSGKLVSLVGVEDLIVVESEDAILVMPKNRDQDVKGLYDKLPPQFQ